MKRIFFLISSLPLLTTAVAQFKTVTPYVTSRQSENRMAKEAAMQLENYRQPAETEPFVLIDPARRFQTMLGIGGALTDAAAETFAKLPAAQQQELLSAYYDAEKGIGYTLARTNINSCDFSSDTYTYVSDNDKELKTFDVKHDEQYKIPLIKQAMASAGGKLTLYVTPWSPPAWMKTNNDMLHGGTLADAYKQAWANYYVKFIKTYENKGMPVWGLSVQNEPMARQKWESCIYTAEEERDFIKNYLGPTLKKEGMNSKKLIAWDHNRDLMYQRASVILNDAAAAQYVWGIGYHWYETWTGGPMQFQNEGLVSKSFPDKSLIFTEGCQEKFNLDSVMSWSLGERYGYSMINDFNNGTCAWTDWNILLDEKGGPNHVGNFCFAPVHADTRTGKLIYTNAYYYIGHFSKWIKPGAQRISASSSRAQLQTTAFRNPDGSIAVVVLNISGTQTDYHLLVGSKAVQTTSQPHSITTLIVN